MTGRIAIIDGVPTNRIVMKVRLSAASHEVLTFGSARDALARLPFDRPSIILIGASLPDASAMALCRDIRKIPALRSIPILVQTDPAQRLATLSAGATGIIDPADDEQTLLARIRSLLRDQTDESDDDSPRLTRAGSEGQRPIGHHAVFIADQIGTGLSWRYALSGLIDCEISVHDPERALAEAQSGPGADLYLISADILRQGDGLRLLSELRSRPHSREAAFLVSLRPDRVEMTAVALDLGAGDVLPHQLSPQSIAAEAAIRIQAQLEQKLLADRRRREARRNLLWAMTDPLTGLHNRRFAMPKLGEMIAACSEDRGLAVFALDLDRFKRVNDTHGHGAGDQILISVAERLSETLPDTALIARVGGEEFVAAVPIHDASEAQSYAEALREHIAHAPIRVHGEAEIVAIDMTVSVGVSILLPAGLRAAVTPELLISRADRALLVAKSQGRNRIIMAPQGLAA